MSLIKVCGGLLVISVVFAVVHDLVRAQDKKLFEYEFKKARLDAADLILMVEQELGISLRGETADGYLVISKDRVKVVTFRELAEQEKRVLAVLVDKAKQTPEKEGSKKEDKPVIRHASEEWRQKYKEAETDSAKLKIISEYLGLE